MPIKTRYEIFSIDKKPAILSTYDRLLATVEFNERMRRGDGFYRMQQTPEADGALTKPEEYLLLVYRVRKLWRQYFDQGRDHAVLLKSVEEEKKLDDWNARTRRFLDTHLSVMDGKTTERFGFFIVVEGWRKAWKERKAYARRKDCDEAVLSEISKKCRHFEKEIDKYIKDKLQLI